MGFIENRWIGRKLVVEMILNMWVCCYVNVWLKGSNYFVWLNRELLWMIVIEVVIKCYVIICIDLKNKYVINKN